MKPVLQALVLADHVYQDKYSSKIIVAGIFSSLNVFKPVIPSGDKTDDGPRRIDPRSLIRAGSPSCYINMTSIRGELPLELRYVDLEDNAVLMSLGFAITNTDPLRNVEIIVPVPMLPVPHPGSYALELLTDDELIGSHRINAIEHKQE